MTHWTDGLPGRIELRPGESVPIPLPSAMGGGYTWAVEVVGDAAAAAVEVGDVPALRGGELPESATAPEALVVSGREPGRASIRLRLTRSWQRDSPLAEHTVEVDVLP